MPVFVNDIRASARNNESVTDLIGTCPACGREFKYQRYHAGFGNQGYLYCDSSPTVLVWGSLEQPAYRDLIDKHPWMLDRTEQKLVEQALAPCPCGGRFRFDAPPRCPHCRADISALVPDKIYYVDSGDNVDGDSQDRWLVK